MFEQILVGTMVVVTAFLFFLSISFSTASMQYHSTAALHVQVTTLCKDGICYDPNTKKVVGRDLEAPQELNVPFSFPI